MPKASRFARLDRTNQLIEGGCHFTAAMRAVAERGAGVGSDPVVAASGHCSTVTDYLPSPDTMTAYVRRIDAAVVVTMPSSV